MNIAVCTYYFLKPFIHMQDTLGRLLQHCPTLRRFSRGSIFSGISFNFGPSAYAVPHRDWKNMAEGLYCIQPLGNFDPDKDGEIVLCMSEL